VSADSAPGYGCAFWLREEVHHRPHLHFIISYPEDKDGWVLVVGVTSNDQWRAAEFVLHAGDHPGIRSACVLSFASLKLVNVERLARGYREMPKLLWAERKAHPGLIDRIQRALLESKRLEARFAELVAKARERTED